MKSHAADPAHLREAIRAAGLRVTRGRVRVLGLLHGVDGPISHTEVTTDLDDEGWDRATLYRNLADLTEAGLLRRVDVGDHVWRFELADADEHAEDEHPHFLCTECGNVSCLPEVSLSSAGSLPQSVQGGQFSIQLRGVCDGCFEPAG